jgi:hypothetical protein
MSCDPKIFGGYNILIIIIGCVGVISGLLVMAQKFPETVAGCGVLPADKKGVDDFNRFVGFIGLLCVIGALMKIVGGSFGCAAGFKINKCFMITACVLLSIGCVMTGVTGVFAFLVAGAFDDECKKRVCNAKNFCPKTGCVDLGPGSTGNNACRGWCKGHYDYFCTDLKDALGLAGIVFILSFILAVPSCGCSCGAVCCCPSMLGYDKAGAPPATTYAGQQVVGQPVEGVVVDNKDVI